MDNESRFHCSKKERLKVFKQKLRAKTPTRFQCAQKHARRVIYKLSKFPLQKGTVNEKRKSYTSVIAAIVSD